MDDFQRYLGHRMEDPVFRQEWEEQRKENEIARQIIQLRKEKGLTQSDLAKKLNTQQSVISRIENGEQNITLSTLDKIAKELGARIEITFKLDSSLGDSSAV